MKTVNAFVFLFCMLGLVGAFFSVRNAVAQQENVVPIKASDVNDDTSLQGFVMYAADRLENASSFEGVLEALNEFRKEGGDWRSDSTYLILLTKEGGV